MLIVEFVGLSGCGKSTLCKKILKEIKKKGIKAASLQKTPKRGKSLSAKIAHFIKSKLAIHSAKNQRFSQLLVDEFRRTKLTNGDIHQYWTEKMLMLNYDFMLAERCGIQVGLVDEGCIQFMTSILNKRKATEEQFPLVEMFKQEMYKSRTIFVRCELEPEKCFDRMMARGRGAGAYDGDSYENSINNLKIRKENMDLLLVPLKSDKQITARMEGDDSIGDILELIYKELEEEKVK